MGEVVYERQGADQTNIAPVNGVNTDPVPVNIPIPKYPKTLKRSHTSQVVTVTAVVAQNGRLIDAKTQDNLDADVRKCVLDVLPRYRLKPATLDGHPIAILVKLQINFQIF